MDAQAENPHPTRLTNIVEDVVDNRLARLERLVLNIKDEQNTRETAAEKALKARTKKERKERENEREELVEAIRDMALEEKEKEAKEEDPVLLKDCVGRNFVFPFEECRGWKVCRPPTAHHPTGPNQKNNR